MAQRVRPLPSSLEEDVLFRIEKRGQRRDNDDYRPRTDISDDGKSKNGKNRPSGSRDIEEEDVRESRICT